MSFALNLFYTNSKKLKLTLVTRIAVAGTLPELALFDIRFILFTFIQ
jgi:hypothetical protein